PEADGPVAAERELAEIDRRLWVMERSIPVATGRASLHIELERLALPRFLTLVGDRLADGDEGRRVLERQARPICEKRRSGWVLEPRPSPADVEQAARSLVDQLHGLGPVQRFLDDPSVSEIMVNGANTVLVERSGRLERTDVRFRD